MKTIILAAGQGKRMNSTVAKVLHCVLEKPMLKHVLDNVAKVASLDETYVIVGHNKEQIEKYISDNKLGVKTIVQENPQGTGHAVAQALKVFSNYQDSVLVLNGDMPLLQENTLRQILETHSLNQSDITILTAKVDNPKGYGRVIRDAKNNIMAIVEEKDADSQTRLINEINVGIYCFNWNKLKDGLINLKSDNNQKEYYLTDLIKYARAQNYLISNYLLNNFVEAYGVNSRQELAKANRLLSDININKLMDTGVSFIDPDSTWIGSDVTIEHDTIIYPNTFIIDKVSIGSNCIIGPNSNISGHTTIGNNSIIKSSYLNNCSISDSCTIGPFSNIRFDTIISNGVKIGNFVEVKASKINSNTNVSHLSYIGDSEIGTNSNIGAGTITANYNHHTKQKFKTIIGSNVAIGSNSVLVAPVIINDNCLIGAGSVITKEVPDNALAITRAKQTIKENYVKSKELLEK